MRLILLLLLLPFLLIAQDKITINLNTESITFLSDKKIDCSYLSDKKDYFCIKKDSSFNTYYRDNNLTDTFFYVKKTIVNNKNILLLRPSLYSRNYELYVKLTGKSWRERDSILNSSIQEIYNFRPVPGYLRVSYKVSHIQYYQERYPYIDIHKTFYQKSKKRKLYTSEIIRILIIGEIWYYIHIYSNDLKTTTSILKSRKAVCHDFKRLVNNITIIEKEEPSPSK